MLNAWLVFLLVMVVSEDLQRELRDAHAQLLTANAQLETVAATDSLTGLWNRRRIEEALASKLHRAARYGTAMSVLLMDADRFKEVNDTAGHGAGDDVLREIGSVLTDRLRGTDMAGCWGGDEFLVLLPETGTDEAARVAEALRSSFASVHEPGGGSLTVSAGVATLEQGESASELLLRADAALYEAKRCGRDRIVRA